MWKTRQVLQFKRSDNSTIPSVEERKTKDELITRERYPLASLPFTLTNKNKRKLPSLKFALLLMCSKKWTIQNVFLADESVERLLFKTISLAHILLLASIFTRPFRRRKKRGKAEGERPTLYRQMFLLVIQRRFLQKQSQLLTITRTENKKSIVWVHLEYAMNETPCEITKYAQCSYRIDQNFWE